MSVEPLAPEKLEACAALNPRFDAERALLWLDLDHGKANEIGSAQLAAFVGLCDLVESESRIRCVCTTSQRRSSKGKSIFIAGANVTERVGWDVERIKAHVVGQRELMVRLRRLPVFTIALVDGIALGWGVEFLLTADFTISTPAASFALPETGLGILPGARGTAELSQLVGLSQAMRLGCTGERIDAAEAARIGLVSELVDDHAHGRERVHALAKMLVMRSPTAVAAFKRGSLDAVGRPEMERIAIESDAYQLCVDSGEAAIGRESFGKIRAGEIPNWGPRRS